MTENQNGFNHIASPVPRIKQRRIIANDLPPRTITPSSFDYPKRKDVIQVELPQSTTKIIDFELDPNNLMKPLSNNYGNSLKIKPGMKQIGFLQIDPEALNEHLKGALNHAETAENRADALLSKITVSFRLKLE